MSAQDKLRDEARRERERRDLVAVAATPEGARLLCRLVDHAGLYRTSLGGTPEATYAREGERNYGLWLVAILKDANVWPAVRALEDAKHE